MRIQTKKLVRSAVLAAISILLMLPIFEIPLPFFPPWLKIDISTTPVLLAGFAMGPWWGLGVQLIKSLMHIPMGSTGGVGELADFLAGAALMLPAALIYTRHKSFKAACVGLVVGSICMCIVSSLANYFILVPLFFGLDPSTAIAGAVGEGGRIHDLGSYIAWGVVPFNALKSLLVSLLTMLLYKRIRPLLRD